MDDLPDVYDYIKELDYKELSDLGAALCLSPQFHSPGELIKQWLLCQPNWACLVRGLQHIGKLEIADKIKLRPGNC